MKWRFKTDCKGGVKWGAPGADEGSLKESAIGPGMSRGASPEMTASGSCQGLSQLMTLFNHTPCPEEYCLTDNFICLTRFC